MIETLAHGYSSESTQQELSNEYQHNRVSIVFKNLCVLVLWTKISLYIGRVNTVTVSVHVIPTQQSLQEELTHNLITKKSVKRCSPGCWGFLSILSIPLQHSHLSRLMPCIYTDHACNYIYYAYMKSICYVLYMLT